MAALNLVFCNFLENALPNALFKFYLSGDVSYHTSTRIGKNYARDIAKFAPG